MPTMNVYVPDELKAAMEAAEGINWSRVAQAAFARAIEMERIKAVNIEEAKLERLRGSRVVNEEAEAAAGVAAGKAWALDHATYAELERVAAIDTDDIEDDGWDTLLADALFGEGEWNRADVDDFCDQYLDARHPKAYQVRGFVEGAQEVFDQV